MANWKLENADLAQKAKRDEAQRQRLEAQDAKRIADEFKRDEAKRKAEAKLKPVEEPVLVFPEFKIEAAPVPAPLPVPEALEDNSLY